MTALFWLLDTALGLIYFLLIANVIVSWLIAFNVINSYQPIINSIVKFLYQITEPLLRPIRRFLPTMNGIDLSALVALLLVHFLRILLVRDIAPALGVY